MKLFYSPGACSLGIHIVLEEIGKPFELQRVKLMEGEQYGPQYTAITPKSKVPCLVRDDGSILTEYGAIAFWLAKTYPDAHLLPHAAEAECRAVEAMDYAVGTAHMQGFARIARPTNFAPDPDDAQKEKVQARGRDILGKAYGILADKLGDHSWVAGDEFSIGDTAVFYVCSWSQRAGVELPPRLAAHFARMKERASVQRVIASEGLSL